MSKREIPKFVKVIVAIIAVAFIGTVIACVVVFQTMKDTFSTGNAEKIAQQIVELPRPLPPGWRYGVGMDIAGYQKTVNLQNSEPGGRVMIQFISQSFAPNHQRAEAVASKFQMPTVAGMSYEVDSRGETTIGGQKAYYVRLHGVAMSKKQSMEVALIDTADNGLLQIQMIETGTDKFDPELVDPLIKSIKSIRHPAKTVE